jgi:hypothetical protein
MPANPPAKPIRDPDISEDQTLDLTGVNAFVKAIETMREYRAWWALNNPVAYVWLCRAERRGAVVPWAKRESGAEVAES